MNLANKLQSTQNRHRAQQAAQARAKAKAERVLADQLQYCLLAWSESGEAKPHTPAPATPRVKPPQLKQTKQIAEAIQTQFTLTSKVRMGEPTQAGLIANLILENAKRIASERYRKHAEAQEDLTLDDIEAEVAEENCPF